jgi:uncharacterized membrane protein (UPF0182 family)
MRLIRRGPTLAILLIAAFFIAVTGLPSIIRLAADWYWFDALGFQTVFLTSLGTKLVLGTTVGLIAFAFFFLNLRVAQRGLVPDPLVVRLSDRQPGLDLTQLLRRLAWPIALVLALLMGLAASSGWLVVLRFLQRTAFGEVDPVFGRDIGYYLFTLPVVSAALGLVFALTIVGLLMVVPLYLLRRDIVLLRRRVTIEPSAERHLAILIGVFFLAVAANVYFVGLPSLLYSTTGPLFGASYTDLATRRPLLHATWVTALLGAGLVLLGMRTRRLARNTGAAAVLLFLVSAVLGNLVPAAMQRLVVIPNELVKETPQLEHHITATRRAWGLDEVLVRDLTGEAALTLADIQANAGTIRNVRLWDREPLLQTFGQLQEIRTYYDFVSVDDDRYWIDGQYRQVLLSPRELNSTALPTRTFINERLTFSHGMGLTLSPVNQVTVEGLPVLFIKDLPPVSSVSLQVTRPDIYFGELSNDYMFVKTGQREFDFPAGDVNVFTTYEGIGGVPTRSWFRRAVLSARFGSLKILLSDDITNESRALYHREIRERAAKALPFLGWDSDPYIVITDEGHLKWILDAYTFSSRYPYAQPAARDGINYMRNSVKVVIDAYDGTVEPYVADPNDPLVATYGKIFGGIFLPLDSMPADLRAHIRYPEDLFAIQTELYTLYHMIPPATFYYREDQWQIPSAARPAGARRDPFLRHIVMKLPGEEQEEFILMVPFTPRQKDNLAAWMVARNDGEHLGQLVVYRFPRQSLVFGPVQIVNRINQNTEISRQVSLWDQRGSEVIRGNLLVIPIEESLIFVQAVYLRAEGGQIPELKRVVVAYQNRVVMEETLAAGLAQLFGTEAELERAPPVAVAAAAAVPVLGGDRTVAQLAQEASDHYEQAMVAQRAGDWARYGEEIRIVGELVRRLQELAGPGN